MQNICVIRVRVTDWKQLG